MPGCAAIGCNNRSEKGYTMKCFPRDPALRTLWTEKVCRADWVPSNNSFLCHVHFDADQWILTESGRIRLKRNAIPSIFTVTSTRKSPKKRRKLVSNKSHQDIYLIGYRNGSLEHPRFDSAHNTPYFQLSRKIKRSSILGHRMRSQAEQQEVLISDEGNQSVKKNGIGRRKQTGEPKETTESKVKTEMAESNHDYDDLERKLRWICEGESQPDEKVKIEVTPVRSTTSLNKNGKIGTYGTSVDENLPCSRLNGDTNDSSNVSDTVNRKRRSKYEDMRETENNASAGNPVNGINTTAERDKKPHANMTPLREPAFTIKVTGMDEDVSEIVKSLGSEPICHYKSTESTSKRNGFVTSIISVVDHSMVQGSNELLKPKEEVDECFASETTIATASWNGRRDENLPKLSVESPNDEEGLSNCNQLRKKIKFQEEVIRTLTKQLVESNDLKSKSDKSNCRTDGNVSAPKRITCSFRSDQDSLLKDLSEKLIQLDEVNRSLNSQLSEKNRHTKKLEWQIRQRDNRIKELNWKLEKASKYLERAEKNTNTYRKKMINMQSVLTRRKLREEKNQSKDVNIGRVEEPESLPDSVVQENCKSEEQNAVEDNAVYITVQDIFDESNDCDNDPFILDTREDFLREFKGAL